MTSEEYEIGKLYRCEFEGILLEYSFVDNDGDRWFRSMLFNEHMYNRCTINEAKERYSHEEDHWAILIDETLFKEGYSYTCLFKMKLNLVIGVKKTKLAEKMLNLNDYYEKDGYLYEIHKDVT